MDKQAWCIKGPDGRLCTTISTISEQDAWDIFMGCDDSPDRYKADGYRAVPVTVSEQNAAQGIEVSERGPALATAPSSPAAAPSEFVRVPREQLQAALNYILHCGANQIMRGDPHPQQHIVDWLNQALSAPPCPDGNEWNSNGPTGRACKTCGGSAVIHAAAIRTRQKITLRRF